MQRRSDNVPAEPICRALRKWLAEHDLLQSGNNNGGNNQKNYGRYFSPYEILSERTGLHVDTLYRYAFDRRHEAMRFDVADLLLASIDAVELWRHDPELSRVYEQACKGADKIYPIALADGGASVQPKVAA